MILRLAFLSAALFTMQQLQSRAATRWEAGVLGVALGALAISAATDVAGLARRRRS